MSNGFKKGIATNPNGKKPGTLNKTTKDIKEAYRLLIENNLENLTAWLKRVAAKDPEKAIRIVNDLSEYVIPKLARTDITSGDRTINPININVISRESADKLNIFLDGKPE